MFVYLAQHPIVSPLFFADHDVSKLVNNMHLYLSRNALNRLLTCQDLDIFILKTFFTLPDKRIKYHL